MGTDGGAKSFPRYFAEKMNREVGSERVGPYLSTRKPPPEKKVNERFRNWYGRH